MPFGLPPPVYHNRAQLSRDSAEFAWPAEPPGPHGPPQPYMPPAGTDGGAAVAATEAAAGGGEAALPPTEGAGVETPTIAAEGPRGSLLFGFGGAAAAEAMAARRLAEHRALVDAEHLRLEYAMAAMDAAGARTRRHWRRVSRHAEAEAWAGEEAEDEQAEKRAKKKRAGRERLTGLHRSCQWKLAGNEHEGQEPGRFRPVLQAVVAAAQGPRYLASAQPLSSSFSSSGGGMSMEDVGLQLARKCSRYIVDIVKTEADGEGLADSTGAAAGGNGGGEDDLDGDDVWGVIGSLSPDGITPNDAKSGNDGAPPAAAAAAVTAGGSSDGSDGAGSSAHMSLDVVEEVSSSGETPAARARREEEERRLVEERVKQATAAVASRGGALAEVGSRRGSAAGPKVDVGPGAGRWRRAVAVAGEAVASGTGASEMVVLVTPKRNIRGRLSLVDKVRR